MCSARPSRRPGRRAEPDAAFYPAEDLRALVAYAADRFVTVIPEVDMPGHVSALMRMHPELRNGQNDGWLDPALPATATCPTSGGCGTSSAPWE